MTVWAARFVLLTLFSGLAVAPAPQSSPTAQEILALMDRTYAEAKSYRDSGVVKVTFYESTGVRLDEVRFLNAFDRATERFRFDFSNSNGERPETRYIVWQDRERQEIQLWQTVYGRRAGTEPLETLVTGLARAAGVSYRSSYDIPLMLFRDQWASPVDLLKEMSNAQRLADNILDGKRMYRVTGTILEIPITVWIAHETFLVHRIDKKYQFPTFRTEQTTTYSPIINAEIPDEFLIFNRPK